MDKIFNFFSKPKSKDEIEKQKRNSIINTQNLQNFANVNQSSLNNNAENNSLNINTNVETSKTINFTSKDFENIDRILNEKQDTTIKSDSKITENDIHSITEINTNLGLEQAKNFIFNDNINKSINQTDNGLNTKHAVGDVVMVNSIENIKKPSEGFYTKKYKEQISNLKSV